MGEDLVAIAKVVKSRGLRGEAVAEILTDYPERFERTEEVVALLPGGIRRRLKIENYWFQKDRVVLKFADVASVEDADALRGAEICVPEADAVDLEEGEFFDWQLAGCEVVDVSGERLGTVKELMRTGGTEILVVEGEGREYLIPFAGAICPEVDVEAKKIVVDPPEGLLEF
jgi:16S rRNA processing protein RimM